jgi:hypothetical protein
MRKILFFALSVTFFACSSESEDPQPVNKIAETQEETPAQGCAAVITTNMHTNGVAVKIRAEFAGCYDNVGFEVKTSSSRYRSPASCDVTEKTVFFASAGEKIKVGLYPCGGEIGQSGKSYKLTIEKGGVKTVINAKIGNVNEVLI